MAIDPKSLPRDTETLRRIVVDLAEQLDRSLAEQNKYQSLLRELLEAQRNRKSEQLSKEQLALFEAAWQARSADPADNDDDLDGDAGTASKPNATAAPKRGGRQPLARHLKRERVVHDLAEAEKHCQGCGKDLRLIAEETSERYEYIPASMKVILPEIRLRLHGEDRHQAAAADREGHGGSQLVGASDRGEMGRPSAAAPAGKDVRAARHRDLA